MGPRPNGHGVGAAAGALRATSRKLAMDGSSPPLATRSRPSRGTWRVTGGSSSRPRRDWPLHPVGEGMPAAEVRHGAEAGPAPGPGGARRLAGAPDDREVLSARGSRDLATGARDATSPSLVWDRSESTPNRHHSWCRPEMGEPPSGYPLGGSAITGMGLGRVELPTSRLSGVRSNHLSYRPLQNRTE